MSANATDPSNTCDAARGPPLRSTRIQAARSRIGTDAALDAEIKADPKIGTARRGALPIKVGSEIIGAISVSGAPGGDKDEVCAQAALDKVKSQLK